MAAAAAIYIIATGMLPTGKARWAPIGHTAATAPAIGGSAQPEAGLIGGL
jgi:hypothetical protein